MIFVIIKMKAPAENRKELLQTLRSMIAPIREEKGCMKCHMFLDDENENFFILIEEWKTQRDLDNHLRSDRFGVLMGTKSLLYEPPEIRINAVSYTAGMEAVKEARDS